MSEGKRLILNIDDVGLVSSINEAADQLLNHYPDIGLSVIPNGDAVDGAVAVAKQYQAPVGVHLGLVQETPVAAASEVSSLLTEAGFFPKNYRSFIGKYYAGSLRKHELEVEIDAQIERVVGTGLTVTHLDAHQHVHLLPGLFDLVVRKAREYDIPYVRTVNEKLALNRFRSKTLSVLGAKFLSWLAKRKTISHGRTTNDFFLGVHPPVPLNQASVTRLVDSVPAGITEWGIHVSTRELCGGERFHSERSLSKNLNLFRSEWFSERLKENEITLIGHGDVSQ